MVPPGQWCGVIGLENRGSGLDDIKNDDNLFKMHPPLCRCNACCGSSAAVASRVSLRRRVKICILGTRLCSFVFFITRMLAIPLVNEKERTVDCYEGPENLRMREIIPVRK